MRSSRPTDGEPAAIGLLALAGLSSALFSGSGPHVLRGERLLVGLTLGLALAAYFAAYERHRDPLKLLAFLAICTPGWDLAWRAGTSIALRLWHYGEEVPLAALLVGGAMGAFLVAAPALWLFGGAVDRPERLSRWVRSTLLAALCGGVLAAAARPTARIGPWGPFNQFAALFVVWQTGVAVILGLALTWQRRSALERQRRGGRVA